MARVGENTRVEKTVMAQDDIHRILWRMTHQIIERHKGAAGLFFVGIPTRGLPLAHRLALRIRELDGEEVPVASLDIRPYRDDLSRLHYGIKAPPHSNPLPLEVKDKKVIIVDDVLFTGRSARAALDAITDAGRPSQVQLAVLVDRGHRELPIRADYVGKNMPTSLTERVQVRLKEVDSVDEVVLIQPGDE